MLSVNNSAFCLSGSRTRTHSELQTDISVSICTRDGRLNWQISVVGCKCRSGSHGAKVEC